MTKNTIETRLIHAPSEKIMAIIADFLQYPIWSKDIKQVMILDEAVPPTQVQLTVEAIWIKETYELHYRWEENAHSVSWTLASSSLQKSQAGRITLYDVPAGTRVEYSIFVELKIPIISVLRRKIQAHIARSALDALKLYAENNTEHFA